MMYPANYKFPLESTLQNVSAIHSELSERIPKEAFLKEKPMKLSSAGIKLINHTDQDIRIKPYKLLVGKRAYELLIGGKYFKYLGKNATKIVAYHLHGQSYSIFFEQESRTLPGGELKYKRFCSTLYWSTTSEKININFYKIQLCLPPANKPQSVKTQTINLPYEIEDQDKVHLLKIFREAAPQADFSAAPLWDVQTCQGAYIKFLNYTPHSIKINPQQKLLINGMELFKFSGSSSYNIVYTVKGHPEFICIETKQDTHHHVTDRYIIKLKPPQLLNKYLESEQAEIEELFALQNQKIEYRQLIDDNKGIEPILNCLPGNAELAENPQVSIYRPRFLSMSANRKINVTIINHTSHRVTFNVTKSLSIDSQRIMNLSTNHCRLIIYKLKGNPLQIYLKKISGSNRPQIKDFHYKLIWGPYSSHFKSLSIFEKARKEIALQTLWRGSEDPHSPFFERDFPKELLAIITDFYIHAS